MAKRTRTGRGVAGKPGRRYGLTDDGRERIWPLLQAQDRGGKWADQSHESMSFQSLMDTVRIKERRRPPAVAGDKGYSYPRVRK